MRDAPGDPAALTSGATRRPVGAYVHFPWCLAKCPYCDFLSVATERHDVPHAAYADAIIAEVDRRGATLGDARLRSIFVGGGTPSLWRADDLGRVIARIREVLPADAGEIEVTAECNPSSFDEGVAASLLRAGVNRVSIGVQSLDDARLRFLGRLHDATGGLASVQAALRAGVPRVSADLIFGVAGQTPIEAAAEVRRIADLGVTHVSAYTLTIEPGTAFGAQARKGRLPLLGEDDVATSFARVDETLTGLGFDHYEVSNFARDGHVARHNVGYWRGEAYLGLGCGAWGTLPMGGGALRYRNTPIPERYLASAPLWAEAPLDRATRGGLLGEVEVLSPEMLLGERIMLGLRMANGVDVESAATELGIEPWPPRRRRAVEKWTERGHLVREDGRLRIPREHWLLSDGVIADVM